MSSLAFMFFPGFFNEANRGPRRATPAPTYPSKPVRPHNFKERSAPDPTLNQAENQSGSGTAARTSKFVGGNRSHRGHRDRRAEGMEKFDLCGLCVGNVVSGI